jgi:hypothetical protein
VKACAPLFSLSSPAKKLVLSPLPRYWHNLCCEDTDHVSNLDDADYESNLFNGLEGLRWSIKDTHFMSSVKDMTIYNTSQLCVTLDGARSTSTDVREALAIMWGDDPVPGTYWKHPLCSTPPEEGPLSAPAGWRPTRADCSSTIAPRDYSCGRGRSLRTPGFQSSNGYQGRQPWGYRGNY